MFKTGDKIKDSDGNTWTANLQETRYDTEGKPTAQIIVAVLAAQPMNPPAPTTEEDQALPSVPS